MIPFIFALHNNKCPVRILMRREEKGEKGGEGRREVRC